MSAPTGPTPGSSRRALVAGVLHSVVALALGLVATPFLLRWLGVERFGAFAAAADWFGHLTLLELGVAGTLTPLVAAAAGRNDALALRRALHAGLRSFAVVGLAALILAGILVLNIPHLVPVSPDLRTELVNACSIALAGYFLMPLGPFRVLLEAQHRRATVSLFGLLQTVVTVGLCLWLARRGLGLEGQFLAVLVGQAVFRGGLALAARTSAGGFGPVLSEPPDHASTIELRRLDLVAFLTMLAGRIGYYTDNILVALLLGPRRVAAFFLTQRLAVLAGTQLLGIGRAGQPTLSALRAEGQLEAFRARILDQTRSMSGLAVAALTPIAVWNGPFVQRWVGAEMFVGDILTLLACANAYLLTLLTLWGWCFSATGFARPLVPVAVVNAVLNLGVGIWATYQVGPLGPPIGTAFATVAVNLWAVPLLLRRHFGVPFFRLAWAAAVPLLWGAPAAWGLWTWVQADPPTALLPLLAWMVVTGLVLLVFWWFLALNAAGRAELRLMMTARRRRRSAA